MKNVIYILPIGVIEKLVIDEIKDSLNCTFRFPVEVLPVTGNPNYAYEPKRQQYYSTRILEKLIEQLPENGLKIIGVTDVDLSTPVLTFVFGEAQLKGIAAVISLIRLRQEYYQLIPNKALFISRAITEAIHELGHTFGLLHCSEPQCVMHFSSNITSIDLKRQKFCTACQEIFENLRNNGQI
jgi:archaemetzincin